MTASSKPVSKPVENKSKHVGTHPDSFKVHDLERGFNQTVDADLDVPRWIKNEFFNSHGPTTVTRLDELTNLANKTYEGRGDTSDRELAREIVMRAGLGDHPRLYQLTDLVAVGLGEIDDPGDWLHGYSSSERKGTSSSVAGSSAG